MYYRNANAALLVFDITQYNTFTAIKSWVIELRRNIEESLVLVLVGNKCDLLNERKVDSEEGRKYATTIGASYHETSALNDEGIEQVFLVIALGLLRYYFLYKISSFDYSVLDIFNKFLAFNITQLQEKSIDFIFLFEN